METLLTEAEFREIIDGVAYLEMDGGYLSALPVVEVRDSDHHSWHTLQLRDTDSDSTGDMDIYVSATYGYKSRGYRSNGNGENGILRGAQGA